MTHIPPIEIAIDAAAPGDRYAKFWNVCVGAGRAQEGLRAGWLEQLRTVANACGFRYVRFHGLFHDDMFVYRENESGEAIYNFQYVNDLFDRLLAAGVRPFVELGFCPGDLARERGTVFWWKGNGSPPSDLTKWNNLVLRTVQNWINRYGLEEVAQWYFEVWNEPNLHPFFRGTKTEYFELYRTTVQTIKSISSSLRVGGPATSNFVPDARFAGETEDFGQHAIVVNAPDLDALDWRPVWVEEFLQYCKRESLPVDFVSCHPYPTDWALDALGETVKRTRSANATATDLRTLRQIIDRSPFPNAEIHLTEWSSSPSPRDFTHDYLQAATFVIKTNVESIGLVDSLSYWVFTDIFEEGGAGDTPFHGGFGLINYQGIPKPTFHAYRMLNTLGDVRLLQRDGIIATRDAASDRFRGLIYHYPPELTQSVPASFSNRDVAEKTLATGQARAVSITITGLPPAARLCIDTLDKSSGNAQSAWTALGRPELITREQEEALRHAAFMTRLEFHTADAIGNFQFETTLEPWSVVLITQL